MRVSRVIVVITVFLLSITPAWSASQLRQIGMVNLPGSPGFGEVAFAKGMLVMTHPAASAVDVFNPTRRRIALKFQACSHRKASRSMSKTEKSI